MNTSNALSQNKSSTDPSALSRLRVLITKPASLVGFLVLGSVIIFLMIKNKPALTHQEISASARAVEYIVAKTINVVPRTKAFGTVAPAHALLASAEVAGRISYIHPELKNGSTLEANTIVLKIDDTDYQLALQQATAELESSDANLAQLIAEEKNLEASLELLNDRVAVAQKELKRKNSLLAAGSISSSSVDTEERSVLAQRQEQIQLQGQIAKLPARKASASAQITALKAHVSLQKRMIDKTQIQLPFRARINHVATEIDQFVGVGSQLFIAHGMEAAEIAVQLTLRQIRPLISSVYHQTVSGTAFRKILEAAPMSATVIIAGTHANSTQAASAREGVVTRIGEELDPQTRTLSVIITVPKPFDNIVAGSRPPLFSGMYTEVTITGQPIKRLVIPRNAVHENKVYVINSDNSLAIKDVVIDFAQGDMVAIEEGIQENEKIVVTDLVPAVSGMILNPSLSEPLQTYLTKLATGEVML